MSASPLPRGFVPEPIETTSRSSAKRHASESANSQVQLPIPESSPTVNQPSASSEQTRNMSTTRKLLPQPLEESTRSSRKPRPEPVETLSRQHRPKRDLQEVTEDEGQGAAANTTEISNDSNDTRARRKLAPQPVETTSRSSRKFAPEPVETSKRSRRSQPEEDAASEPKVGKQKFFPQPVETTTLRRRGRRPSDLEEADDASHNESAQSPLAVTRSLSGRKFSPELLETARGSYKRVKPIRPMSAVPTHLRPAPAADDTSGQDGPEVPESRFSAAALAKRHHLERQHSYATPDLPVVQSDSSGEESDVPSLSASPSISSDDNVEQRLPFRGRQNTSSTHLTPGFPLGEGEKLLREQAMAAYINEQSHEPVDHFAIDLEDDESHHKKGRLSGHHGIDISTFRRDSAVDLDWHLSEMRKHHSELEALKKNLKENTAGASRFSAAALASRKARGAKKAGGTRQKGMTFAEMRIAASPPMLGDDIVFPRSVTPKHTRLTPDQVPVPRKTGDRDQEVVVDGQPKLWSANIDVSNPGLDGLWMGMCHKGDESEHSSPITAAPARYGLMTPAVEREDPCGSETPSKGSMTPGKAHGRFGHGMGILPLSPPREARDAFAESLGRKLTFEQEIDKEFHSGVVTQVYNYLSLGYPSLAHQFDAELSKISRVPIEELRRDDDKADAKGYVGAPEGEGMDLDGATDGKCARWTALRLYIREWARQLPNMADKEREDWGVRARRGSWAI